MFRLVQNEVPVITPLREEALPEPGPFNFFQPGRRDYLIGIDIAAVERDRSPSYNSYRFHYQILRGSEVARDGRCCGHSGRHEMCAASTALTSLEIPVGSRGTTFAGGELVRVHR